MSGPAIHHIVAKEYLDKVLKTKYTDPKSKAFWDEIEKGRYAPIYKLAAQGPDFLLFNMNDWPTGATGKALAQIYIEVEEFIEEFVQKLKEIIPDGVWVLISTLEAMEETAIERSALLSEISDLLKDVQNNIDALSKIVENKIEEYILKSVDVFEILTDPQQEGSAFSDWWWFDTLHKRRTGRFMKELLSRSAENSMERAFAIGYLTHYTTDTVGHAYVNAIAGGPYRTHMQRHKVAENHQDVWAYQRYIGGEFVQSKLAEEYIVDGNEDELPADLKKFILGCMQRAYYDGEKPLYGKEIKEEDLDIAYRLWLKWFKMATNDIELPEPKPYDLTEEVVEAWEKFENNISDIFNSIGSSGNGGIWGFFEALAAIIAAPFLAAAAAVDFVLGELATLGAAPIRFLLSLSYEYLYDAFLNFRHGVVLTGLKFPTVEDLNFGPVKHLINTGVADRNGNNANSLPNAQAYPASKFKLKNAESESHLIYPIPAQVYPERDKVTGFPASYFGKTPDWYMTDANNKFDEMAYKFYKSFNESDIPNPDQVQVNDQFVSFSRAAINNGLGNSLQLSDYIYSEFLKIGNDCNPAEFNLDSDRGYAFKCWRKVSDTSLLNSPQNDYLNTNVGIEKDREVLNVKTDIIEPYGGVL